MGVLGQFREELNTTDIVADLRAGLIGEGIEFSTPFGVKKLVYADYTASGRALRQIETFVLEHVLPFYANSHTEASHCGAYMTAMREEARNIIEQALNVGENCTVIFSGSGATAAINRAVALSGVSGLAMDNDSEKPVVFIGPYEHHSNILPWRESGAEIVEIEEDTSGGPDLDHLERELIARSDRKLLIGSFSAASNVSGVLTNVNAVTKLLKQYGALSFWDYAGGGPYIPMDMNPENGNGLDAIFLSPHKFPGGPGASGILVIRNSVIKTNKPTWPGGGSVAYVSSWGHDYLDSIAEREESGTPNIIGDIRAALVFLVKDSIGQDYIEKREKELREMAFSVWGKNSNIKILASEKRERIPIFSFLVGNGNGDFVNHYAFTKLLSDFSGIQARGGCACAGPYGHRLLNVNKAQSEAIRKSLLNGDKVEKPGWIRLNLSYLMDDETAKFIIDSVDKLANNICDYIGSYPENDGYTENRIQANQVTN